MLMMTFSPISMRPSSVADAMCGSSTTFGSPFQARVDAWRMLEDVEPRPRQLAPRQHPGQRVLVDDLAPRGVDQIAVGFISFSRRAESR